MTTKELLRPTIRNHGLFAEHDMPCPVCLEKPAVMGMGDGTFAPCWSCQEKGHALVRTETRFQRWLYRTFFKK